MKERAAELRAEGRKGAKQADGLQDSSTRSRPWHRKTVRSLNECM